MIKIAVEERWECVGHDYIFLVDGGLRDGEALARRLGFTNAAAFERFCYRHRIHLRHKEPVLVGFSNKKKDGHSYDRVAENPPDQLDAAVRQVQRHVGSASDQGELLEMLGLAHHVREKLLAGA